MLKIIQTLEKKNLIADTYFPNFKIKHLLKLTARILRFENFILIGTEIFDLRHWCCIVFEATARLLNSSRN